MKKIIKFFIFLKKIQFYDFFQIFNSKNNITLNVCKAQVLNFSEKYSIKHMLHHLINYQFMNQAYFIQFIIFFIILFFKNTY